jgi:uncharacterized protein YegL
MPAAKKQAKKKSPSKPAAAASGNTLVNVILDKSGSMGSCVTDTIGGFNTYKNELKKDKKSKYLFSLTLFDTSYENRHVAVPLEAVPDLDVTTYVPGGMTALYDAIGKASTAVESSGVKYDKVLTVIMTDGQENSSREYRLSMVKELITRKEKEGWTFVFLGADLSAFAVGDAIGTQHANSVVYTTQNMGATFSNLAAATMSYSHDPMTRGLVDKDLLKRVPMRAMRAAGMSRRTSPSPFAKRTR